MTRRVFLLLRLVAMLALSGFALPAAAICFPQLLTVGDSAGCTDGGIQSAIDKVVNNASCPSVVAITRASYDYVDQHLSIADKTLRLIGYADGVACNQISATLACGIFTECPTVPLRTLDGSDGGRVLSITGASNVTIQNLTITGGATGGDGGGIRFNGTGTLTIDTSTISNNMANSGAGIAFIDSGGGASLRLLRNSLVLFNTATNSGAAGGGIFLSGHARLYATSPQTFVAFNHATNGYGGGLAIAGSARADIGSPGLNGAGVIFFNDAINGGGVAVVPDGEFSGATLRLFTVDPSAPVQIENNAAADKGGGVYVGAVQFDQGRLCAFDFRLDKNQASDGAAIYAASHSSTFDPDKGGAVYFNAGPSDDPACGPESPPSLGAIDCAADAPCNEISANTAADLDGMPTNGAVITLASAGTLLGDPFEMRGNAASELIRATGNNAEFFSFGVLMRNCLIADNHTQHELVSIRDGRDLAINGCTIVGNTIDNGYVFYTNIGGSGLRLVNSIFDQPGLSILDFVGDNSLRNLSYLIANETFTLGGADHTQGDTPSYFDAANHDYHLKPYSPGVDYAPAQGGTDLDGLPRTIDLTSKVNLYGPRDLGAYETQTNFLCDNSADVIFCAGFEP